jgi:hypothetical protein
MGAGRQSLIAQHLGESLLMALVSLGVALVFVVLLVPGFNQLAGKSLSLHIDLSIIISALIITLLTGLASGSYPAFYISGFKPMAVLKAGITNFAGGLWLRKGLVVFQFTLSAIFIVSVLVIYKQMQLIETKNLGYNRDNILYFEKGGIVSENKEDYIPGAKYDKELESMMA